MAGGQGPPRTAPALKARVVLRRAAELDIATIEDWYETQQAGLGVEFREAVSEALARVGRNPLAYPERYRESRRVLLRRFPYVVWYKIQGEDIVILACVHGKRNPHMVRKRVRENS